MGWRELLGMKRRYKIERLDAGPGSQVRRQSSLAQHLAVAPPPQPNYKGKKYPHVYQNKDKPVTFPAETEQLQEYIAGPYPYNKQNAKGKARIGATTSGQPVFADPGYQRIVTDNNKKIKGVIYHPYVAGGHDNRFVRAEEVYSFDVKKRSKNLANQGAKAAKWANVTKKKTS
ncbi:hypothetical protein Micbo1qcDRAFT_200531 [Microdochium bolleyi]|uniref:Uncharacterized protein n=1 Tax=Microdochium bolleyi TaxID=196109 RepID=A0A136JD76_9PEZI|nr:hypothetical protein Micbo1qcDRAFT_200531 [Microdochium bolleyi]